MHRVSVTRYDPATSRLWGMVVGTPKSIDPERRKFCHRRAAKMVELLAKPAEATDTLKRKLFHGRLAVPVDCEASMRKIAHTLTKAGAFSLTCTGIEGKVTGGSNAKGEGRSNAREAAEHPLAVSELHFARTTFAKRASDTPGCRPGRSRA